MATNNEIDIPLPVSVSNGGLGTTSLTANGVIYGNGTSAVGVTSVGTAGQVLTANGAGSAPTFQNAPTVSGNLTLISSQTLAGSSTGFSFTSLTSTYKTYLLVYYNIATTSGGFNTLPALRVSNNNGVSWVTSGYLSTGIEFSGSFVGNTGAPDRIVMTQAFSPNSAHGPGMFWCYNIGVTGQATNIVGLGWDTYGMQYNAFSYVTAVNALAIQPLTGSGILNGTISGTVRLYGMAS